MSVWRGRLVTEVNFKTPIPLGCISLQCGQVKSSLVAATSTLQATVGQGESAFWYGTPSRELEKRLIKVLFCFFFKAG